MALQVQGQGQRVYDAANPRVGRGGGILVLPANTVPGTAEDLLGLITTAATAAGMVGIQSADGTFMLDEVLIQNDSGFDLYIRSIEQGAASAGVGIRISSGNYIRMPLDQNLAAGGPGSLLLETVAPLNCFVVSRVS